jgi:CheY-like chemotaxis protein/HPt (histidine-containing phosphotransfer) domain-containing protein
MLDSLKFNPRELVTSVDEVIAYRARGKSVDIASTLSHGIPALLRGDAGRIRQVLINLMDNAVKFTERGAVVLTVTAEERHDDVINLSFCVEDTGAGIPEAAQDKLFDEFSQLDSSDATQFGGTGLGLAICKQLVELMGGEIGVDSRPGRGSRFWFEIPLDTVEGVEEEAVSESLEQRLLLIGLSRLSRAAVAYQYELLGCQVDAVVSGREGLQRITENRDEPYDYVLVDEAIEDIEVPLLAQRARGEGGAKLILIPQGDSDSSGKRVRALGFDQLLQRPFHVDGLLAALDKMGEVVATYTTAVAAPVKARNRGRILLAEDSEANQMVARVLLEREGYEVVVANDGREAVEAFSRGTYDLILMDLRMPNMTGLEATEEIRKRRDGQTVPIVAMTANALQTDIQRCMDAGMNDYVSKPFEREHLLRVIKQMIELAAIEPLTPVKELPDVAELNEGLPLVDDEAFGRLASDTSAEVVPTMVEMFLNESRERVELIDNGLNTLELSELGDQAHTIKSLAGTFGAPRLLEFARAMEYACLEGDREAALKLGALMLPLYEETAVLYQQCFTDYSAE